jgi:hypothetical protein
MDSHMLKQYLQGEIDGLIMNPQFSLVAGVLMEIPIVMILFPKVQSQSLPAGEAGQSQSEVRVTNLELRVKVKVKPVRRNVV